MFPLADTGRPDAEGITHTHIHGSAHSRARPISTHIVSNLCNAMQFLVRRHKFNAACEFQQAAACVNWVESRSLAIFLFEHDFFGKPTSTSPHHARDGGSFSPMRAG